MEQLIIDRPQLREDLSNAWETVQKAKPGIRIREAAKELGVGEAELVASKIGENCIRLRDDWKNFLKRLPELGKVMSLTRNDYCILEHKGTFHKVSTFGEGNNAMATVIGPIETRVFFKHWHVGFAVTEQKSGRTLKSFQIFDRAGEAITKIYLQEKSNEEAYYQIIADFTSEDQSPEQKVFEYENEEFTKLINYTEFISDWDNLKDTHDFIKILKKYKVERLHALELAQTKYTYKVHPQIAVKEILETASSTKCPIMIFAGNRGNLQIHQGKVRTIRLLETGHMGPEAWLNVLDPDFNMHLKQDYLHSAWVVNKPTAEGIVTSVEFFDKNRKLVVQFFGLRKPGIPQREDWTKLVANLPRI